MFTSKKAQYLDKDFNNISPITNIDTLYYEQAYKSGDEYEIIRHSVAKNMPIRFNISDDITKLDTSISESSGEYAPDVNFNVNYTKAELPIVLNPYDNNYPVYDHNLFTVNTKEYVKLNQLLSYYTSREYFSSSTNEIKRNILETSTNFICLYNKNTSTLATDVSILTHALYEHSDLYDYRTLIDDFNGNRLENNGIYNLIYEPDTTNYKPFKMIIKVACVSINDTPDTLSGIKQLVSLDVAYPSEPYESIPVNDWEFHYDINTDKLTYLKDEFGNEANFDFRNQYIAPNNKTIFDGTYTETSFRNNKIFVDNPANASIIFVSDANHIGNQIFHADNILFNCNSEHNIIKNSSFIDLKDSYNNKNVIINSNNIHFQNANNNIVINNKNSNILILGNNNTVVNTENQQINLINDNQIICDSQPTDANVIQLNNDKLYLNGASKTAITNSLDNAMVFGGPGHDVSVFVESINTLK